MQIKKYNVHATCTHIYASIQHSWCLDPFVTIEIGMMNVSAWGYGGMWVAGYSSSEHQAQDF